MTPSTPAAPGRGALNPTKAAWMQGFAVALTTINRMYDNPTVCKGAALTVAKSVAVFKAAGCEDYDLKELRKIWSKG